MRHLLACTCLTPIALMMTGGQALAQTTISTALTTPVRTSTVNNGAPNGISITTTGSVRVASGTAVTVDSSHSVSNAGTIEVINSSNANGILIQPGTSGSVTNGGSILLLEDFTPTDGDNDGDLDGPFAQGSNRYGIRLAPGGTYTGNISNLNRIEIEGNGSVGIALDSSLVGSLVNNGSVSVIGNDSQGIRAGDISGNVRIAGSVGVRGQNSVGVALDGDIGGALVFQGSVSATGYRYTSPPASTAKLDADDLLQGGPAIRIAGNVAGGIVFAVPPPNASETDDDEDDDGIKDAEEGSSVVNGFGAAPAVQIGSTTQDVSVGAVAGQAQGHGLLLQGIINGAGIYAGVDANGVVIGGTGHATTIAGGMTVTGSLNAISNGANATALRIGSGASVPEIRIGGTVRSSGGGDAGDLSRAIRIDQGASVTAIRNVGGTIEAAAGKDGSAIAIVDATGGVTTLQNQGAIVAAGGSTANGAGPVAIDLSANQTGVTISQSRITGTNTPIPRIQGDVRLGGGSDLFEVAAGSVSGRTFFGAGADTLALSGDAVFTGTSDFGAGADRLQIGGTARFQGSLVSAGSLDVALTGGTLHVTQIAAPTALSSLSVGTNSILGVDLNGTGGASTRYDVAGAASFADGTRIRVRLLSTSDAAGRYVVVDAGSLTVGQPIALEADTLPFLFQGAVETNAAAGEVAVTITRRTAAQLGLNASQSSAYDAVFAALGEDAGIESAFLNLGSGEAVRAQISQMLPDHAGGVFETVTLGSRTTARFLTDPSPQMGELGGGWRFLLQQAGWGTSKDLGDTAAYDVGGWSASAGVERLTGIGSVGGTIAYLTGSDADGMNDNNVNTEHYEVAAYWRGSWGGFSAFARGSAGFVAFDSSRFFSGTGANGEAVTRTTNGEWQGQLFSLAGGISYELRSGRFTLRPSATLDYYRLSEDGYAEDGGGDGFDLIVEDRTSDELAGTLALAAGYSFMTGADGGMWLRGEVEGGRRQILGGELGETVARFGDGNPFTLEPEERSDGWTGALRLVGGLGATVVSAELRAEEQSGHASVGGRLSLVFGF